MVDVSAALCDLKEPARAGNLGRRYVHHDLLRTRLVSATHLESLPCPVQAEAVGTRPSSGTPPDAANSMARGTCASFAARANREALAARGGVLDLQVERHRESPRHHVSPVGEATSAATATLSSAQRPRWRRPHRGRTSHARRSDGIRGLLYEKRPAGSRAARQLHSPDGTGRMHTPRPRLQGAPAAARANRSPRSEHRDGAPTVSKMCQPHGMECDAEGFE